MQANSVVLGIAAAAALGVAALPGSALAAACTTAPLSTYLAGGANATCTVLDKTFSNFTYTGTNGNAPPASSIEVTPLTASLTSPGPGLQFNGNFSVAAGKTTDIALDFDVTAGAGFKITGASVTLVGTTTGGGAAGSFSDSELIASGMAEIASLNTSNTNKVASTTFAGVTGATVDEDILLIGYENLSTIIKHFAENSTPTPEPASLGLLGVGLGALGLIRRRQRRS